LNDSNDLGSNSTVENVACALHFVFSCIRSQTCCIFELWPWQSF